MEFQSLQRGGGQMMSFRVPPCHCYHDVHQQMTIISVTTKFMDGANLTPSWCHDFIIRLVFKKKQFLLVGDINPSKKYVLKESKNPKTNKFQHMSHKAVQGTSIDIALFEIRKGRGFQCGHLR